ncbi:hypothetical protein BN940_04006 [Castellaniella defragrans 65Phen]|uniref:Uncharacterized protein n=1 Tax=Castellaniella defragrans (strain DSM 12143 / CCUG 39792 / 65Phen) TaxID=1437824 RepID=W8X8L3_CASD6|nr:cache domain-containing protein [Castellaniella defragrans]CDM23275.1 hypothetical protein BN940_04006 [Castellaniella defragrans 65Phen]
MRTPLLLILALASCALAAVFGATVLTVRIEQQAIDQTLRAHEEYVLGSLRSTIETNLTLGLALEQNSGLQRLIEREKSGMPDIRDISIYGARGQVLYSTDLGKRGGAIPAGWIQESRDNGTWCVNDPHVRRCGAVLQDELGRTVGGLILVVPHTAQAYSLQAWLARGLPTLALAVLAVLVAGLGAIWLARRRLRPFLWAGMILKGEAPALDDRDPLVAAARRASERHLANLQALGRQRQQMKELDHAD